MKSFRKNGKEKPIIIGDNIKRKRHGFFRFLKNFKFPDLSDNPKVQFMNKFSLLACILVFTIECVSRHSFTSAVSFCISSPLTFLYNALLIFATLLIVYLFKHRALVRIVISIFWMLLGVINGCVLASRVTPFNFADLKLIGDLLSMKNSKYLSAGQEIAVVILLIALATFLILFAFKGPKFKGRVHLFRNLGLLVLCVASIPFITKTAIHSDILSGYFGNLAQGYKDYGFVYSFSASVVDTGMSKPANYTEETIDTINDNVTTEPTTVDSSDMPNIIFMQLETFIDPYELNFLSYSEDPIPNLRKMFSEYSSGYFKVPSVGAGTANTEFEVLTGMSMRFFGPGEYPYKTYAKTRTLESAASALKGLGYGAEALHNNGGNFYSRAQVFNNMGFDHYTSKEFMNILQTTPKGWATDDILVPNIMESMDTTEGQDFVFTVSVEGHGEYPTEKVLEDPEIVVSGVEDEGERNAWEYYVNLVHAMDEFAGDLVRAVEERNEPTVLVFYGDHLPTMNLEAKDLKSRYLYNTNYVIWDNIGLEKKDGNVAAYQVMADVFERLDIHAGTVFNYHQQRRHTKNYLADLELLQYDIMYGDQYVYAEEGSPMKEGHMYMGVKDAVISQVTEQYNKTYSIYGENFTKQSKVFINGEKQKTTFLNNTRLDLKESKLSDGDTIMVAQVGSSNTTFRTTKTYKYNAGTLTEMPPEKDAPENGRQAFVVEKEEKEK